MLTTDSISTGIDLASEISERYRISSIGPLAASCRSAAAQDEITVAIVGRFKAGKSSFINDLIGRPILPVGVVPVTAVVTEIRFGTAAKAEVHYLNGRVAPIPVDGIAPYVSERENPENRKRVATIAIELPGLDSFRGLRFVDTPGLDSVLGHNTDASLRWLPNAGLALVAVSVDPPLSQRDIELLYNLYRYTPHVTVLLTKVDLLTPEERSEVLEFVRMQLAKNFNPPPEVLPYSVRPGYSDLKACLEQNLFRKTLAGFDAHRRAILARKADTLLGECAEYLALSLKSAELAGAERETLQRYVAGEKEFIADLKSELSLIVRDAAGRTRSLADARLESHRKQVEDTLLAGLESRFPSWTKSLAYLLDSFEDWIALSLAEELARVSLAERAALLEPLHKTQEQIFRHLQQFRDRLSDRTMSAFGVRLRTTEAEIEIQEPVHPDVGIGRVFDRNWELLSPVLPVVFIKSMVRRHFTAQVRYVVYTNLSRLTSQWEQSIIDALLHMRKEAERRLDDLVATVGRLIESGVDRAPAIRTDLDRIAVMRGGIA